MYKKILIFILMLLLVFTYKIQAVERVSLTLEYDGKSHLYQNEKITLVVNDRMLTDLPMQPIILNDRTYVPAREVFEALGAVVDWKAETKQIYIGYGDTLMILEIDKPYININGTITQLSVAPKIINNKTMIPARFAAEALGFFVHWNPDTRVVSIIAPSDEPTPTPAPTYPPVTTAPPVDSSPSAIDAAKDVSYGPIAEERHNQTQITDILLPSGVNGNVYTITASSEISRVEKILLKDNRFILDIYNAEASLTTKTYDINSSYLKSVRVAQNQIEPEMVTRVVFDITAPVSFAVSISSDRKSIIVNFDKNFITNFSFVSDGYVDQVIIEGVSEPIVSLFPLTGPDRLVIDLPLSTLGFPADFNVNGIVSTKVRSSQFDTNTSRIVVDLTGQASYSVSSSGNKTVVSISRPLYRNINYDYNSKTIIIKKSILQPFSTSHIIQTDNYLNLNYNFTLPGDYFADYGSGTYLINDGYVNSVTISNNGGRTNIAVNETKIMAYTLTEDQNNIYIKAVSPKQMYSRIVIIDPGHGGNAPGTSGNGMIEKNLTLDIALRLINLLEANGTVKVYSTRLDDSSVELGERAIMGNDLGDIYVSIHINAYNKIAEGTETLYYPHSNDSYIGISCESMAELFQRNLLADLGTVDRKAKYQDVQVLRETTIPAVLTEICFIDSPNDAANLMKDEFRQRAAASLMKSILQTFDIYKPKR